MKNVTDVDWLKRDPAFQAILEQLDNMSVTQRKLEHAQGLVMRNSERHVSHREELISELIGMMGS
jgi:hypothetical protein